MLPSNEKLGSNRFWPYPNIAKHPAMTPQPQGKDDYQVNLLAMLKDQVRHNMELAKARKHKAASFCFDIEKTKRDDEMDLFFDAMASEDKSKYIKKTECIDEGFHGYLKSINPYR